MQTGARTPRRVTLLDGIEFKQTAYALDRDSRKAALAHFLKRASGADSEEDEEGRRLAA
ncbi:translation initiation factor 2 beta subunit (eIF-2beta)/eIF-5 [Bradyrhizobium sp. USDA 4011]